MLPQLLQASTDAAPALLRIEGLTFSYPSHPVFDNWSASFAPGLHLVCGDDGCGKTTLLRLLAADLLPQAGVIERRPHQPGGTGSIQRQTVFRTDPASDEFDALLSLEWFERLCSRYPDFDRSRADEWMDRLFLREHQQKTGHMLSTGSKRKVWLAAALASNAELVLIDQPFAALDAPSIRAVTDLLREIGCGGQRIVIVADYDVPAGLRLEQVLRLG